MRVDERAGANELDIAGDGRRPPPHPGPLLAELDVPAQDDDALPLVLRARQRMCVFKWCVVVVVVVGGRGGCGDCCAILLYHIGLVVTALQRSPPGPARSMQQASVQAPGGSWCTGSKRGKQVLVAAPAGPPWCLLVQPRRPGSRQLQTGSRGKRPTHFFRRANLPRNVACSNPP